MTYLRKTAILQSCSLARGWSGFLCLREAQSKHLQNPADIFKTYPNGCLLYDGTCGACSHFIGRKEKFFAKYGFAAVPAQESWVVERLGQDGELLAREMRLLRSDGSYLKGADVYREITAKVWWLYPLHIFSRLPVLSCLFNFGYNTFAANRHKISAVCNLESHARYKK